MGASGRAETPDGEGWLSVTTTPYSKVVIEGESVGLTPITKHPLPAGTYKVKLVSETEGSSVNISVNIQTGKVTNINKKIVPPPKPPKDKDGFLSVMSTPPTTVYVDGNSLGTTPLVKEPLKPGKHKVSLISLDEEIHYKEKIVIKPGKHVKIVKSFGEKAGGGTLSVTSDPFTTVYVDGNKIGTTPIAKYKLEPGSYKVKLMNGDFGIDYSTTVTITKGKVTHLVKSFKKASTEKGTLSVMTQPPTMVFVDGKKAGNTPVQKYGLTPGVHEVRILSFQHYLYDKITVNIEKGKNTKITKSYESDWEEPW
jgi:major membrane immunogen (membrane-anchored lipoprotein)